MKDVCNTDIPQGSLLASYETVSGTESDGNYCDCFSTTIAGVISLEEFVYAFYTSGAFALERKILTAALGIPATHEDAKRLSTGESNRFSGWTVEDRLEHEMLLRFPKSSTGSWFMVRQNTENTSNSTELLFGSVVFPKKDSVTFRLMFYGLSGFHRVYSSALLGSTKKRLLSLSADKNLP